MQGQQWIGGHARLICCQWALLSCHVRGAPRSTCEEREQRAVRLEELTWRCPENKSWPKLGSRLRLQECTNSDMSMLLTDYPSLASLNHGNFNLLLFGCRITDEGLQELEHVSTLTFLGLGGCVYITDAGLKALKHTPSALGSLNQSRESNITESSLTKELGFMSALASLDLSWCSCTTDVGLMKELKHVHHALSSLTLACCKWGIAYSGLKELWHVPSGRGCSAAAASDLGALQAVELALGLNGASGTTYRRSCTIMCTVS